MPTPTYTIQPTAYDAVGECPVHESRAEEWLVFRSYEASPELPRVWLASCTNRAVAEALIAGLKA